MKYVLIIVAFLAWLTAGFFVITKFNDTYPPKQQGSQAVVPYPDYDDPTDKFVVLPILGDSSLLTPEQVAAMWNGENRYLIWLQKTKTRFISMGPLTKK